MTFNGQPCEGQGFWISPDGCAFPVDRNHITTVCLHPALFGCTEGELRAVFAARGEVWCREGKAREEIIVRLVEEGWIRLRHYRRGPRRWSANAFDVSPRTVARLWAFFQLVNGPGAEFEDVVLDLPAGRTKTTVHKIRDGSAFGLPAGTDKSETALRALASPDECL